MGEDTLRFVAACPVCAQNKSTNRASSGLLHPLPIPRRPWSHLALDFVTGLPSSVGNTVILTIVDRFSKFAHFVPLSKLPSATETSEILVGRCSGSTGCPVTLFLTVVLSLPLLSGNPSVWPLELQSVSHLDFTPNLMVRRREPTRRWSPRCVVLSPLIPPLGHLNYPGSSMPIIPFLHLPLGCPPSNACTDTNLPCFLLRRGIFRSLLSRPTFVVATGPGIGPGRSSLEFLTGIRSRRIVAVFLLPLIPSEIRCGWLHGIFLYGLS
ncbi:unnamed protein product [Oncorhynchus mykiss]|uniref:Integrase catalytic domain-containing protein n=1 Tax=Oncorhynchus mykiss TaxID=8022 RepID=A0A060W9P4_ONCMY|nr:unnamed protein product [Oncorhynchus mykiss]